MWPCQPRCNNNRYWRIVLFQFSAITSHYLLVNPKHGTGRLTQVRQHLCARIWIHLSSINLSVWVQSAAFMQKEPNGSLPSLIELLKSGESGHHQIWDAFNMMHHTTFLHWCVQWVLEIIPSVWLWCWNLSTQVQLAGWETPWTCQAVCHVTWHSNRRYLWQLCLQEQTASTLLHIGTRSCITKNKKVVGQHNNAVYKPRVSAGKSDILDD